MVRDIIWREEIAQFQAENSSWLSLVMVVAQPKREESGAMLRLELLVGEL